MNDTPKQHVARWASTTGRIVAGARRLRELLAQRLSQLNLSDAEFSSLWLVHARQPHGVNQREIACHLGLSPARISGIVERLRTLGLLASERSDKDRRKQHWRLTADGAQRLDDLTRELSPWIHRCLGQVSASEHTELANRIEMLVRAAEETADHATSVASFPIAETPDSMPSFIPPRENKEAA